MTEHETALLRYATRILNNPTSAQDVVQNVFIKLFNGWDDNTASNPKLKSWLFRVTHNEAVDHIRKESRLKDLHEKQAEERSLTEPERGFTDIADERFRRVMAHVRRLNPREQQVVLLRLEEGLSYREISDITGRTVGNVGNILHHAVKKLAKEMKKDEILK